MTTEEHNADVIAMLERIAAPVSAYIEQHLSAEITRWSALDNSLVSPLTTLRDFVATGGKRLRPAFCRLAYVGAGGHADDTRVIAVGAALEMLHTFALIHDDVMDDARQRRGFDAVHVTYEKQHRARALQGNAQRFGEAAAILIGDMAFVYTDLFMQNASREALDVFCEMRIELNIGQYLDINATAARDVSLATATRIARYKSGKYTVERPMHLGVALLGRYSELAEVVSAYGEPVGEAFQLRDDILGAFGDPDVVGKSVGGDIREGKPTAILAIARANASATATATLDKLYGKMNADAHEIELVQEIFIETGAKRSVESTITQLSEAGLAAIDRLPFPDSVCNDLAALARFVAGREH